MRRSRTNARSGFTLLEVTIAIGILAFGLLGIAGMQLHAMKQGRAGKQTTEASTVARTVLETFNRMPFASPLLNATAWTAPTPLIQGAIPGADPAWVPRHGWSQIAGVQTQGQVYNVAWRIVDGPVPPIPPWPVGGTTPLKFIDVRVTWVEPDFPNGRQVIVSGVRYDDAPTDL